jgi:hypothetical protein
MYVVVVFRLFTFEQHFHIYTTTSNTCKDVRQHFQRQGKEIKFFTVFSKLTYTTLKANTFNQLCDDGKQNYGISRPIQCIMIFSLEILEKKKDEYFNFSNLLEENRIVTYQN